MKLTAATHALWIIPALLCGCDNAPGPTDGGLDGGDGAPDADEPGPDLPLVVNEINAKSPDWLELVNDSDEPLSMTGLSISDQDDSGSVHLGHLTALPARLTLEAGEAFVVVANPEIALEGVVTGEACLLEGVDRCVHVTFGLSHSNGDGVFVVDSNGAVVAHAAYPPEATSEGQTWCRIPDVVGDLQRCAPTPAAPNE